MLNSSGFDLWADDYDKSVNLSEEADSYPFAGYKDVLNRVYCHARAGEAKKILDIGFGTGILSGKLYDDGCLIYGMDFSDRMIELAGKKMKGAKLIRHDFAEGFPELWDEERFECILSTYALHHLDDEQKFAFIKELKRHLKPGGRIVIGDIAFETAEEMEQCRKVSGEEWDEEEKYLTCDAAKKAFPDVEFEKISFCAGVFVFYGSK
ncbi:class I SAM-dependent methyltransferase [Roseburia hominis]